MLFAEAVDNNKSLNVTYCPSKKSKVCRLNVNPDVIEVQNNGIIHRIALSGLNISCVTCKNLCSVSEDILCFSFDVSYNTLSCENKDKFHKLQSNIHSAENILCKFCQQKLGNIKDVTCSTDFSKPTTLGEESLSIEGGFFCHENRDNPVRLTEKSVNVQELLGEQKPPSPLDSVFTGLELILDLSLIEPHSLHFKENNYLHCSSCLMALGKKVLYGSRECIAFWTNCFSLLVRENDIDGDFLGFIEKPLIADETDFYGLLIANLVKNNHYRIIISAITWDGLLDFMLLWLPDQTIKLYTTSLQDGNSSATEKCSEEDEKNGSKSVHFVKVEPIACRRVFYRLLLCDNCSPDTSSLLDSWRKDFGVTLIHIPWETCIGFSVCLSHFSSKIAPHVRKLDAPMTGFTVS
ncbi:unnamed protein product [Heterobilharzia americana]|nr:unnamed protein product [Heterobilharzia americana]